MPRTQTPPERRAAFTGPAHGMKIGNGFNPGRGRKVWPSFGEGVFGIPDARDKPFRPFPAATSASDGIGFEPSIHRGGAARWRHGGAIQTEHARGPSTKFGRTTLRKTPGRGEAP